MQETQSYMTLSVPFSKTLVSITLLGETYPVEVKSEVTVVFGDDGERDAHCNTFFVEFVEELGDGVGFGRGEVDRRRMSEKLKLTDITLTAN